MPISYEDFMAEVSGGRKMVYCGIGNGFGNVIRQIVACQVYALFTDRLLVLFPGTAKVRNS